MTACTYSQRVARDRTNQDRPVVTAPMMICLAGILALIGGATGAARAVPGEINYQGYLTNSNGVPLSEPVDLEFAIFASDAGGNALWTEAHTEQPLVDGTFSVVLGSAVPIDPGLFANPGLWLETRVGGVPMVPRRPFVSVPYAFRAAVAQQALSSPADNAWTISGNDVYHASGRVGIGTTEPAAPLTVSDGTRTLGVSGTDIAGSDSVKVTSATSVTCEAPTTLRLRGTSLDARTQQGVTVAAGTSMSLTSTTNTSITSNGQMSITGSAQTTISGALIRLNGLVGIGTAPGFQLQLSQNSAAKPTSNTWTISSDRRLKKNIEPLRGSLDQLLRLRGVTYRWRNPETQGNMRGTYPGFIAQEVEPVFPEWVGEGTNGYKNLTVIGFEALAVEALRELRAEKDDELAALRDQVRLLQERLGRLERRDQADAGRDDDYR